MRFFAFDQDLAFGGSATALSLAALPLRAAGEHQVYPDTQLLSVELDTEREAMTAEAGIEVSRTVRPFEALSSFMAGQQTYDWAGDFSSVAQEVFERTCVCQYCGSEKQTSRGLTIGGNSGRSGDGLLSAGSGENPLFGNTAITTNSASGDANVDALLGTTRFVPTTLTFSFPTVTTDFEPNYGTAAAEAARTAFATFAPTTEAMRTAARFTFLQTTLLTGLTITETIGPSNFRLALFTPAADGTGNQTAFAYRPTSSIVGGDSWYSNTASFTSPIRGNYAWVTILHEIGHNLGLTHGHESGGLSGSPMSSDRDSMEFSLMTYRSYIGASVTGYRNERFGYAQTFMMYDIAAIQHLYGADFTTNSGDSNYTFSPISGEVFVNGVSEGAPGGNRIFSTIWDGGGIDTYDFTSYAEAMQVDLRAGRWSRFSQVQLANLGDSNRARGNIFNALQFRGDSRSLIENGIAGEFNDSLVGNQAQNRLEGRGGDDTINGGSAGDTLLGGEGNDVLIGDFIAPVFVPAENPGVGFTGSSFQAIAPADVRTTRETALDLTNNFSLIQNSDIQNSTTEVHTTVSAQGAGNAHWYQVRITGANVRFTIDIDNTVSPPPATPDTPAAAFDSYIRLFGAPVGSTAATLLAENDDSPTTSGGGGSSSGLDSYLTFLATTPGTYWVVVGSFGSVDSLAVGTGYSMHISVVGLSRTVGETDSGTPGNDLLNGGNGNDTLIGGLGADILDGGAGIDFASYQNATTGLTLFMGGGTFNTGEANGDTHTSIEGLIGSNFSDIIGGDAGVNELRGLNGNDFMYGRDGVDTLIGGDGNDFLEGGQGGDQLDGAAGIDVAAYRDAGAGVVASLATGGTGGDAMSDTYANIENIWGSRFNDNLSGDNSAGQIYGFEGNDTLSGLDGDDFFYGGAGQDTLTGGAGNDSFFLLAWQNQTNAFGTFEAAEGGDAYTDFTSGQDRVILSRFWFGFGNIGGPAAALTETHANFVTNGNVATGRPSLIWNAGNRTLSFDADGTGATQAVLLGTLQAGATLTLGDIWTA